MSGVVSRGYSLHCLRAVWLHLSGGLLQSVRITSQKHQVHRFCDHCDLCMQLLSRPRFPSRINRLMKSVPIERRGNC